MHPTARGALTARVPRGTDSDGAHLTAVRLLTARVGVLTWNRRPQAMPGRGPRTCGRAHGPRQSRRLPGGHAGRAPGRQGPDRLGPPAGRARPAPAGCLNRSVWQSVDLRMVPGREPAQAAFRDDGSDRHEPVQATGCARTASGLAGGRASERAGGRAGGRGRAGGLAGAGGRAGRRGRRAAGRSRLRASWRARGARTVGGRVGGRAVYSCARIRD